MDIHGDTRRPLWLSRLMLQIYYVILKRGLPKIHYNPMKHINNVQFTDKKHAIKALNKVVSSFVCRNYF